MKTSMLILSLLTMWLLTACAPSGGGSGSAGGTVAAPSTPDVATPGTVAAPADAVVNNGSSLIPVAIPAGVTTFGLNYYKISKTVAPVGGWPTKTYTATGHCVIYKTRTYCWDDGLKSVVIPGVGTYKYTYFGLNRNTPTNWSPCSGGCTADLMSTPLYDSPSISTNIGSLITTVFNTGAVLPVTCAETNNVLNCVDFSIDLNQASL